MPVDIVCVSLIYAIIHTFISTISKYKWMCVSPLWLWLWLCLCLAFARYFILTALSSRWTLIHIVFKQTSRRSLFAYRGFLSNARANRWTFYVVKRINVKKLVLLQQKILCFFFFVHLKLSYSRKTLILYARVTHFFLLL